MSVVDAVYTDLDSHKYRALPLIPLEEFLALYPEHQQSDEHELMVARINHEHAEREKLEQARQELLKRKQALIAENNKRKEDLASLDKDLERFIDVGSPFIPSPVDPANQGRRPNQSRSFLRRNIRGRWSWLFMIMAHWLDTPRHEFIRIELAMVLCIAE